MFFNYGYALAQDSDKDDAYDYFIIGVEGQRVISEDWLIFVQLGFGDKIKDGNDDREGFNDGYILRAGITNFFSEYTAFTADFELAGSRNHIDSSDPGRFFGVTVGGETRLKTKAPLFVNY